MKMKKKSVTAFADLNPFQGVVYVLGDSYKTKPRETIDILLNMISSPLALLFNLASYIVLFPVVVYVGWTGPSRMKKALKERERNKQDFEKECAKRQYRENTSDINY